MSQGFFPPYFLEVSLTWALGVMPLACGLTAWAARPAPEEPERRDVVSRSAPTVPPITLDLVPDVVPQTQTVTADGLAHDVVVDGSSLTGPELELCLGRFEQAAGQWEQSGRRLGVVICNLGTQAMLSYGADERFYPASSIKGPYVISVYEEMVGSGLITTSEVSHLVEPTIVYSDNNAYRSLRNLCGSQFFADWAVSCGAIEKDSGDYAPFANLYYPPLTPHQMAAMWEHAFEYLAEDGDAARQLLGYFERREESPIRAGIDDGALTITKAGWYPADSGEAYKATADAGIVIDDNHCYVLVILTDAPDDLDALAQLVPEIYSAHPAVD